MNSLRFFVPVTATLLVVFAAYANGAVMSNGNAFDDTFHRLFRKGAAPAKIIKVALDWHPGKQIEHFVELGYHVKNGDKYAKYSQRIINGAQSLLNESLKQVGYNKPMDLAEYLQATYKIKEGMINEVDPDVFYGIKLLENFPNDKLEEALNSGHEMQLEEELDNLDPFEEELIPDQSKTPVEAEQQVQPEQQPENKDQPSEDQPTEDQSTENQPESEDQPLENQPDQKGQSEPETESKPEA